jgi:hypothetical protein
MKWKCLVDGYEWESSSNDVRSGKGCPKCAGNMRLTNCEIDERLVGRKISRVSNYSGKNNIKMKWKCLVDGYEWESTPSNLFHPKYPTGCPKCKKKSETKLEDILKYNAIVFEKQFNLVYRYRVDFFIPSKKIVIEYNGEQHYKPIRFGGMSLKEANKKFEVQKNRDEIIKNYCNKSNIKFIEIPHWMPWKDVENIIRRECV